jgi:hypothetical protein
MTTKHASDAPPILLFLLLFAALIVVALGLAVLSSPADAQAEPAPSTGGSTQGTGVPSSERATDSATSMPSTPADMIPPA